MRACLRGPLYGPQSPSGVRGVVEALETLFPVLPAHALCLSLHLSDHVSDFVCEVSLCAVRSRMSVWCAPGCGAVVLALSPRALAAWRDYRIRLGGCTHLTLGDD